MQPRPAPAIEVRCVQGPDAGKVLLIGPAEVTLGKASGIGYSDPNVAQYHVTLTYVDDSLYFRTAAGYPLYVDSQPVTAGTLPIRQYFYLGQSVWQVGEAGAAPKPILDSLADRLNKLASTDKLEGFSLSEMFSEVFKQRTPEEVEDYFLVGTMRTTPPISEVTTGWPKPWFFMRVLLFVGVIYLFFAYAAQAFANPKLIPALLIFGSLATPLATLILFFELNTPRNVSFYTALMMVCVGGVVSMFISLIGFELSPLAWLGKSEAGPIEEIGKFLTVIAIVRQPRYKYILNGLFFGAAVGAGFAAFESAGFAFEALQDNQNSLDAMNASIHLRAVLAPFGHVAWTAITAGAFWRVKGDRPLAASMLTDPRFLKAFCIPVVLHMFWNAPKSLQLPFHLNSLIAGAIGWFVLFGLVQQGLKQVRDEQMRVTSEQYERSVSLTS